MADDQQPIDDVDPLGAPATVPVEKKSKRSRRNRDAAAEGGDGGHAGVRRLSFKRPRVVFVLVIVVVIALVALTPLVAGACKKTPRNMVGISYGGGPFEGAHFQKVVQPGSGLFFNGLFDPLYLYPADQQNYIVSKVRRTRAPSQGADSIVAPSSDRVQVEYQVAVYFKLNTDRLRDFHEQLGLQYEAYTSTGWNQLIQDTFRQQIENALQAGDPQVRRGRPLRRTPRCSRAAERGPTDAQRAARQALGQPYFCGPTFAPGKPCDAATFIIKKIDIPTAVATAFEDNRTSQIEVLTRENEIAQREAEAQAIEALNEALSDGGRELRAAQGDRVREDQASGCCPSGSGVTLQAPSGP